MSHRGGKTFRRTSARDPRLLLLILGGALVLAALVMATCEPPDDLLGAPSIGSPGHLPNIGDAPPTTPVHARRVGAGAQ